MQKSDKFDDFNKEVNNLSLQEISESELSWSKHKSNADKIADYYGNSDCYQQYANRINLCSQFLDFQLITDCEKQKLKLHGARFCRVRYCPVCQWRRSLKWRAKAYKVIPKIVETYPTHRWLFLTLTVKNCKINELRTTISWLNKSWQRFSQRKKFPAVGWLRSIEVTKSLSRDAHPHIHCLLLVKASYYGKQYIKQDEWVKLWKESLRIDYNPVLDIRAVKKDCQPTKLIPEILKYCVKETDLISDRQWFLELTNQMHNVRTVATGGILKERFKQLEYDRAWIIEENNINRKLPHLYFDWRYGQQKYELFNHS